MTAVVSSGIGAKYYTDWTQHPDWTEGDTAPPCDFKFRDWHCEQIGPHMCSPRWRKFERFCAEILVHTKGDYAGRPLRLLPWQVDDFAMPIFGAVIWSPERRKYVRRFTQVWIETARKQGKSHVLAAVLLYVLIATGEEAGEVYGAAKLKRPQAEIVYDIAAMMVQRSPVLSAALNPIGYKLRITCPSLSSFYQAISADDEGALGQDPSGLICDEIVSWKDRTLWDAVATGMGSGARLEPLLMAATTPGQKMGTFAHGMHKYMHRIMMDPALSPHTYVLMRNTPQTEEELAELRHRFPSHPDLPVSIDVFDERNWRWSAPGIGDTITWKGMREQAKTAREDPAAENAFRVFKLAQWVAQTFRWMPMHWYEASSGPRWSDPSRADELAGRPAYAGLDLSGTTDLTSWCLMLPQGACEACETVCSHENIDVIWRFWITEDSLAALDRDWDGAFTRWAAEGWLEVHPGSVIDYERVYEQIQRDAQAYQIRGMDADRWSFNAVIQRVGMTLGLSEFDVRDYTNSFDKMTPGLDGVKLLVKQGRYHHHGNPVAQFCFDVVEMKRAQYDSNLIRPEKPQRDRDSARIDAVITAALAENCRRRYQDDPYGGSAYDDHGLVIA